MPAVALVSTAPRHPPGSMSAYASLVEQALGSVQPQPYELRRVDLWSPAAGGAMWRQHLWRLRHARAALASTRADLYHLLDGSMAAFIPRPLLRRTVITVHDLIPLLTLGGELPGPRPSLPARLLIRRANEALTRCAGLVADSSQTAADLARLLGASSVPVVPLAVRALPAGEPIPGYVMPERFILHVGNNADYKNRMGVLRVFARLNDVAGLHLLMAGPEPTPAMRAFAESGRLRVTFTGPLSDGQLNTLYQRAAFLLFPSRYEGFGMPVLEAMASGCPVVCSTAGSLSEVAGDAALTAPPDCDAELEAHCRRLLSDPKLRSELQARGREQAARYTLSAMGRGLLACYQRHLGGGA